MASHYFGQRRANAIQNIDGVLVLSEDRESSGSQNAMRFVGRLGGEYIFYTPDGRSITIMQASAVDRMTLRVMPKTAMTEQADVKRE